MKAYWGSGCIAPSILDLGTRWRWVFRFTPRSLYFQGKSPWYPLDRRWVGLSRSGSGGEEKNSDTEDVSMFIRIHACIYWSRTLVKKLIITHLVNKLPALFENRRPINVLPRATNWSLSWARQISFNINEPSTSRSLKWSLPFRISN
jgi:hypothetical protein